MFVAVLLVNPDHTSVCGRAYFIGGIVSGSLYNYSALGGFKTLTEALDRNAERPHRSSNDVIIEVEQLARYGVNYGCRTILRSAVDGGLLPMAHGQVAA